MVQISFSHPRKKEADSLQSPTAPLDAFLDGQNMTYYEELYRSEAACLCVLRMLPPVCRQIILHELWTYSPVASKDLKPLCQIDIHAPLGMTEEVLRPAMDRKIFLPIQNKKYKMEWPFNDAFKRGLRNSLTGSGTSDSFGVPYDRTDSEQYIEPTVEELVQYGEDVWENILKYMVSSENGALRASKPGKGVLQLLLASGLMQDPFDSAKKRSNLDRLKITSAGFQFLLEDRQTQLWQILVFYLALEEANSGRSAETLSLFLSLGCMQLGQDYSASRCFLAAKKTLDDLEQWGFIYLRESLSDGTKSDQFFPTHLATALCSGEATGGSGGGLYDKRYLVLETNYNIYAYTSNELQIAILKLFVTIYTRYQNLVVGRLDRTAVKKAMKGGINANQIISYLSSHAHPQMYNTPPPLLHPTIVDQLHLWDKERNRIKAESAYCVSFDSKDFFEDALAEVKRYDALIHVTPTQKLIFMNPEIRPAIVEFLREKQMEYRGGFR